MFYYNLIMAGIFGACMGSFLNVAAHRSIQGRSWWGNERSACESCGHVLGTFELIPIVSWLMLRGRCKSCGAKISVRYILVEIICAAIAVAIFSRWKISWACLLAGVGACGLVLNSLTDIESGDVFDVFAIAPGVLGLLIRLAGGTGALLDGLEGAAAGWGVFAAIIVLTRGGMGWGDASFMGGMGAVLGLKFILAALYLGVMIGGAFVVVLLIIGKVKWGRHDSIPLVPFLSAGCLIMMLYGVEIFAWLEAKFLYLAPGLFSVPWPF